MNIERYFPHLISVALLALGGLQQSAAALIGSVVVMGFILSKEYLDKAKEVKAAHVVLPEDAKRRLQDIEARITTLEYGVKSRGF